jgi:hypothetical protein
MGSLEEDTAGAPAMGTITAYSWVLSFLFDSGSPGIYSF